MLAMVANDDAGRLDASGVSTTIASMLAPTGGIIVGTPPGAVGRWGDQRGVYCRLKPSSVLWSCSSNTKPGRPGK
jgi:hypothetical protein